VADENDANRCAHCGVEIRLIRYVLGDQFVHVDRYASFPTKEKGTAWRHCRLTVAEPVTSPEVPRDRAPQNYVEQRALLEASLKDVPTTSPGKPTSDE
jgi:hypothetical protein